jgi:hypothetical protein
MHRIPYDLTKYLTNTTKKVIRSSLLRQQRHKRTSSTVLIFVVISEVCGFTVKTLATHHIIGLSKLNRNSEEPRRIEELHRESMVLPLLVNISRRFCREMLYRGK